MARNYHTYKFGFTLPVILELETSFSPVEIEALKKELAVVSTDGSATNTPNLLIHPSDVALSALQEVSKAIPSYRSFPCKISSYDIPVILNKCMSIIDNSHVELNYDFPQIGELVRKSNINSQDKLKEFVDLAVEMQRLSVLSFIYDTANFKHPVSLSLGKRLVHRNITEFLVPVSKESIITETKKGFKIIPEGIDNLNKIIKDGLEHWNRLSKMRKDRVLLGL